MATIMAHAKFILDMTVQCNPILCHILVLSNDYLSIKEKVGLFEWNSLYIAKYFILTQ